MSTEEREALLQQLFQDALAAELEQMKADLQAAQQQQQEEEEARKAQAEAEAGAAQVRAYVKHTVTYSMCVWLY